MTGRAGVWIRRTTIGCVTLLALIAGTVSYLHMHSLVALHGQPGWVAALTPLSVDGMIVAASTTLLAESRSGGRGGILPWALLVVGSVASLAANVAVAEPTAVGRVIAAWPSFALIGSYGLLMRQVRRAAPGQAQPTVGSSAAPSWQETRARTAPAAALAPRSPWAGARSTVRCAARAGRRSGGGRGSGRLAIRRRGGRCQAARRLPFAMSATIGGAGSSKPPATRVSSPMPGHNDRS